MKNGNFLREIRLSKGMTLDEVANAVGVTRTTVAKWERDDIANMRRDRISLLAKVLDIDPMQIVYYNEIGKYIKEKEQSEERKKRQEINRLFDSLSEDQQQLVLALLQQMAANKER